MFSHLLHEDTRRGQSRGVLVADAPNFERAKGTKCHQKPPLCLFQNKVGCPPSLYKKFKRKPRHNFDIFGKTYLNLFAQ